MLLRSVHALGTSLACSVRLLACGAYLTVHGVQVAETHDHRP